MVLKSLSFLVLDCCVLMAAAGGAEADSFFRLTEAGELELHLAGRHIATYVWNDPELTRPYFKNLHTLDAVPVSRRYPPDPKKDLADHPQFHPGLWLSFGDVSGSDYWRNKAQVVAAGGMRLSTPSVHSLAFRVPYSYRKQDVAEKIVCEEDFLCRVETIAGGYLLLWDSTFSAEEEFYFGDQEEMGLGIRMATELRAEPQPKGEIPPGVGQIRDSAGRISAEKVWGRTSEWATYEGVLGDSQVGVAILCHPENSRPSWFHARGYGLLVANLFGRAAFRQGEPSQIAVAPAENYRLRYGVFVYDVPAAEPVDVGQAYKEYLRLSTN